MPGLAAEVFRAWLSNAADFTTPTGSTAVNLKYLDVRQNTNAAIFQANNDGTITILRAGVIELTASFDAQTTSGMNYTYIELLLNGAEGGLALAHSAGGTTYWTETSFSASYKVSAGDVIALQTQPSRIANMDDGAWSVLSIAWFGTPP